MKKYKHSTARVKQKKNKRKATRMDYYKSITTHGDYMYCDKLRKWIDFGDSSTGNSALSSHDSRGVTSFKAFIRYAKKNFKNGTKVLWVANFCGMYDYKYIVKGSKIK